jgi:hypothetical protein
MLCPEKVFKVKRTRNVAIHGKECQGTGGTRNLSYQGVNIRFIIRLKRYLTHLDLLFLTALSMLV